MSAAIETAFREAGVRGWLHAVDLDTGRQVCVAADEPVLLASIFKVPLLVTFFRRAAAGLLDPAARVVVRPDERTGGSTGLSVFRDEAQVSLRDLACLMITISDNASADVLFDLVGVPAVNATLADLGLGRTVVAGGCRELFESMMSDAGVRDFGELWAALDEPGALDRLGALDPARSSRSTAREVTSLLAMIWLDEAAPPAECAEMRRLLGLQVWPHRLASGFPYDDVRVSGKTGTLPTVRNEAGVVEYPDGGRYAVAVFTRAASPAAVLPQADAVIGTAARLAVHELRGG